MMVDVARQDGSHAIDDGATWVEVRTGDIVVTITERDGMLVVVADPQVAGLELEAITDRQGLTVRTRITARDVS